jgi:hypothetical protein
MISWRVWKNASSGMGINHFHFSKTLPARFASPAGPVLRRSIADGTSQQANRCGASGLFAGTFRALADEGAAGVAIVHGACNFAGVVDRYGLLATRALHGLDGHALLRVEGAYRAFALRAHGRFLPHGLASSREDDRADRDGCNQ